MDQSFKPAFVRFKDGTDPVIWMMIIHKAWAKAYGSWEATSGGTGGEALFNLTGCPQKSFWHDYISNSAALTPFWNKLKMAD
jgi:hypothetical protein